VGGWNIFGIYYERARNQFLDAKEKRKEAQGIIVAKDIRYF
jgi:hypothetical protein